NEALATGAFEDTVARLTAGLAGVPPLDLRGDRIRPPRPSFQGAVTRRRVPAAVARALHQLAARESATPYMVLLAAFFVLLSRHSDQRDVVVGTPVAGRPRADLERLVGLFLNTVVVRAHVRDADTFMDLLRRVRVAAI